MASPAANEPTRPTPIAGGGPASLGADPIAEPSPWTAWATRAVWIMLLLSLAGIAFVIVQGLSEKSIRKERRKAWDAVFLAEKDAKTADEKIAAYEAVAPKVKGTVAHPTLLAELGRLYLERAADPQRLPMEINADLDASQKCWKTLLEFWPNHPLFANFAAENLAESYRRQKNFEAAIEVLEKAHKQIGAISSKDPSFKFFTPQICRSLAKTYWLRSQMNVSGAEVQADKEKALAYLEEAVQNIDQDGEPEDKLLKSLLVAPGPLVSDANFSPKDAPKTDQEAGVKANAEKERPDAVEPAKAAGEEKTAKPVKTEVQN
jgi:tetratricopeptide (TPR) repeat protein